MSDFYSSMYNPDVLTCLANLSNDEVFTPPEVANRMLDMLPEELWHDSSATFLDPACKSGVFLREIAKRLIEGLKEEIPNLQERIDHIFHKQLYGIAITELTSLLSRRSVYCSKYPNSKYSITLFKDTSGNIRYKRIPHRWQNGKCLFCGASKSEYERGDELETHAYEWIHTTKPEEIFKMKFDVIIGNPPYQMSVGNTQGNSSKARSIYHSFISQAMKLSPRYLCMITPSRWMTRTTEGIPDEWVDEMLMCNKFRVIHDFEDSKSCFPGVEIKGGVNYFLWDREYSGVCQYYFHSANNEEALCRTDYLDTTKTGIIVRDPNAYSIISKIKSVEGEYFLDGDSNFSGYVSPKDFFTNKQVLTSSWKGYAKEQSTTYNIKYYLNKSIHKVSNAWVSITQIPKNIASIPLNKIFIPAAGGSGSDSQVLGYPFLGEANSVCSQTYLVIGYDPEKHHFSKEECKNIISYIQTRFFRYLVSIKKKTQNGPRGVYQFVPIQDFSKPWTDEELYTKYGLTDDEIAFIESMIRPMELGGDDNGN